MTRAATPNQAFAPGGWIRGVVTLVFALSLAFAAGRQAIIQSMAKTAPNMVLRLAPANAAALDALYRANLARPAGATNNPGYWVQQAKDALRIAPLSSAMLRLIATDPARTSRQTAALLQLAERVSRRDVFTQLGLIETAVEANRIDLALRHYDRALSIYPGLRPILFSVLSSAIDNDAVRHGVVALAVQQRPWIEDFLGFAVLSAAPASITALLISIDAKSVTQQAARRHEAVLASRLVGQQDYSAARRLAIRAMGSDAAFLDKLGFTPATWHTDVGALTWAQGETQGVDAQLQPDHFVVITAGPGVAGLAIFRIMTPAPGYYRFASDVAAPDGFPAAGGRWNIVCLAGTGVGTTGPLAEIPINALAPQPDATTVAIPKGCTAVRFAFSIDNANGSSDAAIMLRDLSLTAIR